MLNKHQESIMNCMENVKNLYKEANELKDNLLLEDKKLNDYAQKNDIQIEQLKNQSQEQINKINNIVDILNKNTEKLTEHSTAIAAIQALTNVHSEKIDDIYNHLNNHENRIQNIERRIDEIEVKLHNR